MQVYVITYHQRYESSMMLKISSSLDKALQYLREFATSDNKHPDLWLEENLEMYENSKNTACIYRDAERSDVYYSICIHAVD